MTATSVNKRARACTHDPDKTTTPARIVAIGVRASNGITHVTGKVPIATL